MDKGEKGNVKWFPEEVVMASETVLEEADLWGLAPSSCNS